MPDIISSKTKLLATTQRTCPSHHHATINKCLPTIFYLLGPFLWSSTHIRQCRRVEHFSPFMQFANALTSFRHENENTVHCYSYGLSAWYVWRGWPLRIDAPNFRTADFCVDGVAMATRQTAYIMNACIPAIFQSYLSGPIKIKKTAQNRETFRRHSISFYFHKLNIRGHTGRSTSNHHACSYIYVVPMSTRWNGPPKTLWP